MYRSSRTSLNPRAQRTFREAERIVHRILISLLHRDRCVSLEVRPSSKEHSRSLHIVVAVRDPNSCKLQSNIHFDTDLVPSASGVEWCIVHQRPNFLEIPRITVQPPQHFCKGTFQRRSDQSTAPPVDNSVGTGLETAHILTLP